MSRLIRMGRAARQDGAALPRRVRLVVAREQERSERLIGWIQLLIVLSLGALYLALHEEDVEDPAFSAVPAVLSAYALFTTVRLVLAYRNWLSPWFLMISAVGDVLLLILFIWSLHLPYGQPTAFSLKVPVWGYVFTVMALQTLRLEPRYVVLTGSAAIVGWSALVVIAILDAPYSIVTHDPVAHAYGARIMLGAEIDKLLAIALATIVLALALVRTRRLLVEAASGSEAARDLARFFAASSVRHITLADQPMGPGQGETRDAAVLQIDLKSFTGVAVALSAGQTIRILTEYQGRVVPIIRAHGGQVDKFLGDGIMAVFADDRPAFARDALTAAIEIAATMRRWRPDALPDGSGGARCAAIETIEVSLGIAHGQVVIGAVGAADRLEFTVIGHAVNLAAKLERQTRLQPATVIAAAATVELAVGQGFVPPPGAAWGCCRLRGLDEPVPLVVLA